MLSVRLAQFPGGVCACLSGWQEDRHALDAEKPGGTLIGGCQLVPPVSIFNRQSFFPSLHCFKPNLVSLLCNNSEIAEEPPVLNASEAQMLHFCTLQKAFISKS